MRHPALRNPVAFLLALGAAHYLALCLQVPAFWAAALDQDWVIIVVVAWLVAAAGLHFLAHNTAKSPHALYPAFTLIAFLVLLGFYYPQPSALLGSLGLVAFGFAIAWYKARSLGRHSPSPPPVPAAAA